MVWNKDIANCVPEVIPAEGHHEANIKHKEPGWGKHFEA